MIDPYVDFVGDVGDGMIVGVCCADEGENDTFRGDRRRNPSVNRAGSRPSSRTLSSISNRFSVAVARLYQWASAVSWG